jgi:hypothetical protein
VDGRRNKTAQKKAKKKKKVRDGVNTRTILRLKR